MARPRKFDHDHARRLREEGWSYGEIAHVMGVTSQAVRRVCDPETAIAMAIATAKFQTGGTCVDCGTPCSRNTLRHETRCRQCANKRMATSVREDTLRCCTCREWLPDESFALWLGRNASRRYRQAECRACSSARRQAYRVLHPEKEREAVLRRGERRRQKQARVVS